MQNNEAPITLAFASDQVSWDDATRTAEFTTKNGDTVELSDGKKIKLSGVPLQGEEFGAWLKSHGECPERIWAVGTLEEPG